MTEEEFQQLVEESIFIYERFIPGAATATREMIVHRGAFKHYHPSFKMQISSEDLES